MKAATSGLPDRARQPIRTAPIATRRASGRRTIEIAASATQGAHAAALLGGSNAHDWMPPDIAKPSPPIAAANVPAPTAVASSQAPSSAIVILIACAAVEWCWIGSGRARNAIGDSTPLCGLTQGELPPSRLSDHSGSLPAASAWRTSSSQGTSW